MAYSVFCKIQDSYPVSCYVKERVVIKLILNYLM